MPATSVPRFKQLRDVDPDVLSGGGALGYDAATGMVVVQPQGADVDRNYVHTQVVPASVWTINHNMGKVPTWVVVDSAGDIVHGDPTTVTTTQLVLDFGAAFSGACYLN